MPRYLLQQWTQLTISDEYDRHGQDLWATPSSSERLLDLQPGDTVFVAGAADGVLLPVCRLLVDRITTQEGA